MRYILITLVFIAIAAIMIALGLHCSAYGTGCWWSL